MGSVDVKRPVNYGDVMMMQLVCFAFVLRRIFRIIILGSHALD